MAETTTITKPAPVIEGSLTAFLKSIDKLGAGAVPTNFTGIDTSVYDPKVAGRTALQKLAAESALATAGSWTWKFSRTSSLPTIYVSLPTRGNGYNINGEFDRQPELSVKTQD